MSTLVALPPGRTYAGRRDNWGRQLKLGDLHFFDLLTFRQIVAISPYENFSLNADLIWHFDGRNPAHYNLFNVRYVVTPRGLTMPDFFRPLQETSRYILYGVETGGYARFVTVTGVRGVSSQSSLFFANRNWLMSAEPAAGRFVRYGYPTASEGSEDTAPPTCPGGGNIIEQRVLPGRFDLAVECQETATLVLKVTSHPNWRVVVDGREVPTFMVSPSFMAVDVPAGPHHLGAECRSPPYKTVLLILGACTLLATIWYKRWFARFDLIFWE